MATIIVGLYRGILYWVEIGDNGKENGNYYSLVTLNPKP